MTDTKPVLIFENKISPENIKKLEDAGYVVVCTGTPFTRADKNNTSIWYERLAFEYLSNLPSGTDTHRRNYGDILIDYILKRKK